MKTIYIISILVLLAACSIVSDRQDWSFIEKVGGLSIVGQDKNPDWLIIRGDVSGLHEFSSKPTLVNSAMTVKSVERNLTDTAIQIYVVTTVISKKYPNPEISGIDISGVKAGTYKVQYLNSDDSVIDLTTVVISR